MHGLGKDSENSILNGVPVATGKSACSSDPSRRNGASSPPRQSGQASGIPECLKTGGDVSIQCQMFIKFPFFLKLRKQR